MEQPKKNLVKCIYCRWEFFSSEVNKVYCEFCARRLIQHGMPVACVYCKTLAAFGNSKCNRCIVLESAYGEPKHCVRCNKFAVFEGDADCKLVNDHYFCNDCSKDYMIHVNKVRLDDYLAMEDAWNSCEDERKVDETASKQFKFNKPNAGKSANHSNQSNQSNPSNIPGLKFKISKLQSTIKRQERQININMKDLNRLWFNSFQNGAGVSKKCLSGCVYKIKLKKLKKKYKKKKRKLEKRKIKSKK